MRKRLTDAQIKKIRKELISLYGRRCLKCGSKGQMSFVHAPRMFTKIRKELCVDHILPLSKGGSNEISNFQLLCHGCNISKKQKSTDYRPIKGANMKTKKNYIDEAGHEWPTNSDRGLSRSTHTPTPWRAIVPAGNFTKYTLTATEAGQPFKHGDEIADVMDEANAAYIVRACNNFDRLLNAAEEMSKTLAQQKYGERKEGQLEAYFQLNDAIKAARE
jgi:5-methylcytosine-specific restriction endonuclease McrA